MAGDIPGANEFTIHIMAAVAQHERNIIAERTRAALAAAKRRGVKLGFAGRSKPQQESATKKSNEINAEKARKHRENILPIIAEIKASGKTTLAAIAAELNARSVPTAGGGRWHATTCKNIMKTNVSRETI